MNKTLQISFSLKNTYLVNGILYSLKQIPIVKKLLPEALYKERGLKIFANVLSVLWEILSIFIGKLLYLLTMVYGMGLLYRQVPGSYLFMHILLFLTVIGAFSNTSLFNPSRDKYYAMILMRMNAREYTLVNYTYSIIKVILGFAPFTLWFGVKRGLPVWLCLAIPFSIAGLKLTVAAASLWDYERRGFVYNENSISKYLWLLMALLLGAAYGLPAAGIVLPHIVSAILMLSFIPAGAVSIRKIISFGYYREINRQMLSQMMNQMDTVIQNTRKASEKTISTDTSISSNRKGYEYLNELFIKRHHKILWKSTQKITLVCICLICGILLIMYLAPGINKKINELILTWLPYFVFIMYALNRGTGFTRALFMNCDHSLLTYSFYKQSKSVLKLFQIRLREIMKINAVPALIIGVGLALVLYASGGTDNPMNYVVIIVSILCMSLVFSVHYLTIYYLLQPYNAGTEMKSGTYQLVMSATYLVCYFMMKLHMQTLMFGMMTIVFCVLYSIAACILIYKLAPKTFKLRI